MWSKLHKRRSGRKSNSVVPVCGGVSGGRELGGRIVMDMAEVRGGPLETAYCPIGVDMQAMYVDGGVEGDNM